MTNEASHEAPVGRGVRRVQCGKVCLRVVQIEQVAVCPRWQFCRRLRPGTARAQHPTLCGAERDGAVSRDRVAVPHTAFELRGKPEHAHEQPQPAHGDSIGLLWRSLSQRIQALDQGLVRGGQRCGRSHLQHHF